MTSPRPSPARLSVENVGGIDETTVSLPPGVTVLAGRNATNRTSLLQALTAAVGSERASLKGDADAGRVELELDGETYDRSLERVEDGVVFGGDPYLDDPEVAELFALLLESNDARRAVVREDDLRDVIMRPVDTAAIRAEVAQLEAAKRRIDDRLDELAEAEERRDDLRRRRAELESTVESLEEDLATATAALEEVDADPGDADPDDDAEAALASLRDRRGDLEDVEYDIETERETLRSLREERASVVEELESVDAPDADAEEIEAEIERLRNRRSELDATVSQLGNLVEFTETYLSAEGGGVYDLLCSETRADGGAVTDGLVGGEQLACPTCGNDAPREGVRERLEYLRTLRSSQVEKREEVRERLSEEKERLKRLRETRRHREDLDARLDRLDDRIEGAEDRLARLRDRREQLREEIERLESAAERHRESEFDAVLERHREVNELEFDLERARDDLAEVRSALGDVERELDERADLREERETVEAELAEQRTRVERLEREAVEAFNEHMARVLDALGYENLERVWIERTERETDGGSERAFDLHVVRSTDDGVAYEDELAHLSESEREVTGLVFALAGYLVHDVHDTVPFVLLDSLEAVDADRIAALVEYFADYAEYLVVALLPRDAAALDDDYPRVTDI
jgi:septal ring factor EnvC (AmiA/AmiB activator)